MKATEESVATLPVDNEEKEGEWRDGKFDIGKIDTSANPANPTCTYSPILMPEEINLF